MNEKELEISIDLEKEKELLSYHENEIAYAVQEWGVKNGLRLFGYDLHAAIDRPAPDKAHGDAVPTARAYFTDAGFKAMHLLYFTVKEKSGKVSITQDKVGFKWPIAFCKTREFTSKHKMPVFPFYGLLVDREIILPFKSTVKSKEWQALPFIEMGNMKPVNLFEKK